MEEVRLEAGTLLSLCHEGPEESKGRGRTHVLVYLMALPLHQLGTHPALPKELSSVDFNKKVEPFPRSFLRVCTMDLNSSRTYQQQLLVGRESQEWSEERTGALAGPEL